MLDKVRNLMDEILKAYCTFYENPFVYRIEFFTRIPLFYHYQIVRNEENK
jgi:hypothetical protein